MYFSITHSSTHPPFFLYIFYLSIYMCVHFSVHLPSIHPSSTFLSSIFLRHISLICISISHLSKCLSSIFVCQSIYLSNLCDESTRVCILIHRGINSTLLSLIMSFIWGRKKEIKEHFVLLFSPVSDLESSAWRWVVQGVCLTPTPGGPLQT